MIEAVVTLKKGGKITIYAKNYAELIEIIKKYDIVAFFAKTIKARDNGGTEEND